MTETRTDLSPVEQVIQGVIDRFSDDLLRLADPKSFARSLPVDIAAALRDAGMLAGGN